MYDLVEKKKRTPTSKLLIQAMSHGMREIVYKAKQNISVFAHDESKRLLSWVTLAKLPELPRRL